jgi:hypothetical protein
VQTISREQQCAEKLHAYTLPRSASNSRVKDLVDLVLLIRSGALVIKRIAEAVRLTFARRQTHEMPASVPPPPEDWSARFRSLAEECGLPQEMDTAFEEVRAYLDRVLERSDERLG